MDKLPLPVLVVSVAVAVVLWYIATLLEGDRYGVLQAPASTPPPTFARQQSDSPVYGGAAALRCERSEQNIQRQVDESRYCASDDDCTIFDFGYPIQCLTSVAKSEISQLRYAFESYQQDCKFRVYYDCPAEPLEREAVCRNNRCEVELRTLDRLREQTLRHLGIESQR
jgi:hypothetical protein